MTEPKSYGWSVKAAVLMLILIQMLQSLVNPSLTGIMAEFPGKDTTTYQMIITVATLTECVAALVTGFVVHKVGFKTLGVIGCALALVGGVGPAFLGSSVAALIGIRAIFGIGYGIVYALAIAAIGEFWRGEEATQVSGLVTLAAGAAGIVYMLVSSAIIAAVTDANWRMVYQVNWIILPIMVYYLVVMPQRNASATPADDVDATAPASSGLAGLGAKFWTLMAAVVVTLGAICILTNNVAMIVVGAGLDPASVGIIMACFAVGLLLGGPLYIAAYKALRRWAMPIFLALDLVGLAIMMLVQGFVPFVIAATLLGAIFGCINSSWYDMAAKKVADYPAASPLAGSLFVVIAGVAQFIGPFWISALGTGVFGQPQTNPFYQFYPAMAILAVGAVILAVQAARTHGRPDYERED